MVSSFSSSAVICSPIWEDEVVSNSWTSVSGSEMNESPTLYLLHVRCCRLAEEWESLARYQIVFVSQLKLVRHIFEIV